MGFRFRKSINLGGGVKLNLGKKSTGISFGTKGARVSLNSKGRVTTTVGIPGTGISYQKTSNINNSNKKNNNKQTKNSQVHNIQIPSGTIEFVNREFKIAKESADLVNTTKKADIFFTRYDLLIEKLEALTYFEKDMDFTPSNPSDNLRTVKGERSDSTESFLYRSYEEYLQKINNLKTDKAKLNNVEKFYSEIKSYSKKMDDKNLKTLESLYSSLKQNISINQNSKPQSKSNNYNNLFDSIKKRSIDNEYVYPDLVTLLENTNSKNEFTISKEIIDFIEDKKLKPKGKIDLHSYYSACIEFYFNPENRKYRNIQKVKDYSYFDIGIVLNSIDKIKERESNSVLVLPSFVRLATILEEEGNYQEATRICNDAIKLNIYDEGNISFQKRLKRL